MNDSLGIDEAEIPNREWQHYQLQQEQAGIPAAAILPHASALPVPDYYSDPFYRYYPVVGISYEQAVAFCQWRSQVVTANYNQQGALPIDSLSPKYVRFTFRLPTEAEWMLAARDEWSQLSKSSCSELPVTIPPKAAAYLKKRSGSAVDVAQISADIQRYNAQKPVRSWINYQQQEPYFLQLITPGYVYQSPSNHYKIFQLLGNVAELVQEPGITKGGSYLEPLTACAPEARGTYSGPAPHVGFRCVCVVSYPNRK